MRVCGHTETIESVEHCSQAGVGEILETVNIVVLRDGAAVGGSDADALHDLVLALGTFVDAETDDLRIVLTSDQVGYSSNHLRRVADCIRTVENI